MSTTRGILRPEAVGTAFTLERRTPPADLADVIEHHWIVTWELAPGTDYRSEVLPHPSVHIVFEPDRAEVYGIPHERYVRTLRGAGWAIGTKFWPGRFAPFSPRRASALRGRSFPLETVFGAAGAALRSEVPAAGARDPAPVDAAVGAVQRFLRARLPATPDPHAELIATVTAAMRSAPPATTVKELAARHHVTPRTLQRRFAEYVGASPKWVLRRYRLHEALERLERAGPIDWVRFALELGYYDQAHFVRDFGAAVGLSPTQYEKSRPIPIGQAA